MTTSAEARQVAEYWNKIADNFDAIYTGKKSPLARRLDKWLRWDMYERFNWVMRCAGDVEGKKVCDVGCGSGRFVTALAQKGATVTGLDFAPRMLDLARQLSAHQGVGSRCRYVLTDVLDWKTEETFDLVIAIGFWDYVADPSGRLAVIRRMTSGTFLSAWPRAGTLRALIRRVRLKITGCPVYFWRPEQIKAYLEQAGFRMDSIEICGQLYFVKSTPV